MTFTRVSGVVAGFVGSRVVVFGVVARHMGDAVAVGGSRETWGGSS